MNLDDLKNKIKLGEIKMPQLNTVQSDILINTQELQRQVDIMNRDTRLKEEQEEQYKQAVLNALQGIEKNTGGIAEIVKLVHLSNEKQDQVIELLTEIMSISAAKTKEEAQNKFSKALNKINNLGATVESIQTLIGLLNTVYNSVQPFLT
ncbi:hypothetical protein RW092_18100 [Paenibacillus sp. 3LSP]|uniref:hypothetical protein n=1 Tax=Paenibacillus sp. 3LSP TaxID=2800795 RepID=UPI0028FD51A5|nr:hypothetical protein [Paenibacillus sp. 3LSP]MDU0332092.1 hypothetical protein [Paenibacillus sp. 3LSP]